MPIRTGGLGGGWGKVQRWRRRPRAVLCCRNQKKWFSGWKPARLVLQREGGGGASVGRSLLRRGTVLWSLGAAGRAQVICKHGFSVSNNLRSSAQRYWGAENGRAHLGLALLTSPSTW